MIRNKKKNSENNQSWTFQEHLNELRNRILVVISSLFLFSLIGYYLRKDIISVITSPLNQHLFVTSPTGAFEFTIHISLLFGLFFTIPVVIYNIIGFIEPVFSEQVRKNIYILVLLSFILLIAGILTSYFIFIPFTLRFLLNFNSELQSLITAKEYISFISFYLMLFAFIFQMPLIVIIINTVYRIPIATMLRYQHMVIVLSFILAAFLTPTGDILNQIIVAIPIIFLYEFSILLLWLFKKNLT